VSEEVKHTPGPWKVDAPYILEIQSSDGQHVATVRHTPDWLEAANAHLIAAAPDLLAALERFVELFRDLSPDAAGEDLLAAVAGGSAAIAKAKGS
jgi:hypothetical protein